MTGKLAAATSSDHLKLVGSIAELERGNGIVEAIDPVLVARFRMVAHISDELRCDLSGGELQDTPVYELAVCQEFDILKDLFLARFGRGPTMPEKLRGGNVSGKR